MIAFRTDHPTGRWWTTQRDTAEEALHVAVEDDIAAAVVAERAERAAWIEAFLAGQE